MPREKPWQSFLMRYEPDYTDRFLADLKRYASLRKLVKKKIEQILDDPFSTS